MFYRDWKSQWLSPMDTKETLNKLIPSMVRQAHHERNQYLTVRPEPVEGFIQSFLNDYRRRFARGSLVACALFIFPGMSLSIEIAHREGDRTTGVVITTTQSGALRLQARQATWPQVFDEIANGTGVRVHYSALPPGMVSATCAGSTVKALAKCLLGPRANLVFRYRAGAPETGPDDSQPTEMWVVSTGVGEGQTSAQGQCTPDGQKGETSIPEADPQSPEQDETPMLLEMANAEDAADRAQALSRLTIEGRANDESVRVALEAGLTDDSPEVRAQAINGLASREGAGASEVLREALSDQNADVRLMAVESAGLDAQGVAILQQALADQDETIRTLAESKLQEARLAKE